MSESLNPAQAPALSAVARLADLLASTFSDEELRGFLSRYERYEGVARELPRPPATTPQVAREAAEKLDARNLVDDSFFAALRQARPGLIRQIDALQAHFATRHRWRGAARRHGAWVLPALAIILALGLWWSARQAPVKAPAVVLQEPAPAPTLAPAPKQPFPLTIVYLDPPGDPAPAARITAMASVLPRVLAEGPRAVLLSPALSEGAPVSPLLDALGARASGVPVLGLLPDVEGMSSAVDSAGHHLGRPALPICSGGARACVDMLVLMPFEPGYLAADDPGAGRTSPPRRDRALEHLARCDGSTPLASLALALLAQRGRQTPGDEPPSLYCNAVLHTIRPPADAPCDSPYAWIFAADLSSRSDPQTRDPATDQVAGPCTGWRSLADRVVVLADPWMAGALRRLPLQVSLETNNSRARSYTEAELLAITAWNTLGDLEQETRP